MHKEFFMFLIRKENHLHLKNLIKVLAVNYSQLFSKKLHLKFKKPIINTAKNQF